MKVPKYSWKTKLLSVGLSFAAIAAISMTPLQHGASQTPGGTDQDAMEMLAGRSPGLRPDGALIASKPLAKAAARPRQYAMPKTRERVPPGGVAAPAQPFGQPVALFPQNANALPLDQIASAAGPVSYYPFPGGSESPGGIVIPPVTGATPPGGGVPPDNSVPPGSGIPPDGIPPGVGEPNPPNPPAAVPEPATWINLILGFGAIGTMIRMQRRKLSVPKLSTAPG